MRINSISGSYYNRSNAVSRRATDQKGNVLPDGILLKRGSNPRQLAYLVHTDIGDNFMHAVDARRNMRVASDYELKDGDIISIVTRG